MGERARAEGRACRDRWAAIRCGDDDYAAVVEGAKETVENGGIGDVVDLELVEAEQPGLGGERVGERRNGSKDESEAERGRWRQR
jgi:hypothetical protein